MSREDTLEFVEARIQQWEQMKNVAEHDLHRANTELDKWATEKEKYIT